MKRKVEPNLQLKFKRIAKGMTQEQLAVKCGISAHQVSLYELGKCFPRKETWESLAKALECDVKDII